MCGDSKELLLAMEWVHRLNCLVEEAVFNMKSGPNGCVILEVLFWKHWNLNNGGAVWHFTVNSLQILKSFFIGSDIGFLFTYRRVSIAICTLCSCIIRWFILFLKRYDQGWVVYKYMQSESSSGKITDPEAALESQCLNLSIKESLKFAIFSVLKSPISY